MLTRCEGMSFYSEASSCHRHSPAAAVPPHLQVAAPQVVVPQPIHAVAGVAQGPATGSQPNRIQSGRVEAGMPRRFSVAPKC